MKTKHHLIVALMGNGIAEDTATKLAETCFGDGDPRAVFSAECERAEVQVREQTVYESALRHVREHWVS